MNKLKHIFATSIAVLATTFAGAEQFSSYDIEGDRLADSVSVTNGTISLKKVVLSPDSVSNVLHGLAKGLAAEKTARKAVNDKVDNKADKFIVGKNLTIDKTILKINIAPKDGVTFPFGTYFYATSTNVIEDIRYYDSKFNHIDAVDDTGVRLAADAEHAIIVESYDKATSAPASWTIASVEAVDATVIHANKESQTSFGYAVPQDWNIFWTSLTEPDTDTVTEESVKVDSAGRHIKTISTGVTVNNRAELSIRYFDEVNIPQFTITKYEVVDGPGVIEGNILTATNSGVVTVRAHASNGEVREAPVSMYQSKSLVSYSNYFEDSNPNRKRVNDFHLNLLQNYRSSPSTNYYYTTWNDPVSTPHWSYSGDRFTGEYGKRFHPFQHVTANSGGSASWWWSHAVVSKHVLLAAKHYGMFNHNRILNGYAYINWDGKFSGKVQLKLVRYVDLSEWAAANGFEGDDVKTGDLAFFVVEGEIPDECLPYLATTDYLNATYGVDNVNTNSTTSLGTNLNTAYLPSISLNQANMVGLRANLVGLSWGSQAHPPTEKNTIYEDGIIKDLKYREDLYQYVRLGAWHSVVMGDSGHPTYIYDPNLTTGLTDPEGYPLYRPILMCAYHTVGGGPSVSRYIKVIKAFVESVGDTLPYVLGDPDSQSTSENVIKANAIRAMGGTPVEE